MELHAPADMHIHSQFSDGEGAPEQIVALAAERGMRTISITDHDCLEAAKWAYGYMRHLRETGDEAAVAVLPGVELSSRIQRGGAIDVVHILGLGFDPFNAGLQQLCDRLQQGRMDELRRRCAYVASRGYALSAEAEARVLRDAYWGRGEIARELVLTRHFDSVDQVHRVVWDEFGKTSGIQDFADAQESIDAIHAARGKAVLAHPLRCETEDRVLGRGEVLERIDILQPMGLDGVEAYYRTHPASDCAFLDAVARERGLLTSAGSDHHDFAKRDRLGQTSAGATQPPRPTILATLSLPSP